MDGGLPQATAHMDCTESTLSQSREDRDKKTREYIQLCYAFDSEEQAGLGRIFSGTW